MKRLQFSDTNFKSAIFFRQVLERAFRVFEACRVFVACGRDRFCDIRKVARRGGRIALQFRYALTEHFDIGADR